MFLSIYNLYELLWNVSSVECIFVLLGILCIMYMCMYVLFIDIMYAVVPGRVQETGGGGVVGAGVQSLSLFKNWREGSNCKSSPGKSEVSPKPAQRVGFTSPSVWALWMSSLWH